MPEEITPAKLKAKCPGCSRTLLMNPSFDGKRVKCPQCATSFTASALKRKSPVEPTSSNSAAPPSIDEDDLVDSLMDEAPASPVRQAPAPSIPKEPMFSSRPSGAGVTNRPRAVPGLQVEKPVKQRKVRSGGGPGVFLGMAYGGIAAGLSAAVWFAIAAATGFEIGWLAWGVGAARGVGVAMGMGGGSQTGGVIAAVWSVAAIFFGRWACLYYVLLPRAAKEIGIPVEMLHLAVGPETVFTTMTPITGIFVLLAVFTAYRTGSGGNSE